MDTNLIQSLPEAPQPGSIAEKSLLTALQIFTAGDQKTALDIINFAPVSEATKGALISYLQNPQTPTEPEQSAPAVETLTTPQEDFVVREQVPTEATAQPSEPAEQEEINSESFTLVTPEPEVEPTPVAEEVTTSTFEPTPLTEEVVVPEAEPVGISEAMTEVPVATPEIQIEQPTPETTPTTEQSEEALDLPAFDIPTGEAMTFDQILSEQKQEVVEQPPVIVPEEIVVPNNAPEITQSKEEVSAVNPLLQMLMAQRAKEEQKKEVLPAEPMTTELEVAPIEIAPSEAAQPTLTAEVASQEVKKSDDLHAMLDTVTAGETTKSSRESSFAELFARVSESEKNAFTGEITTPIPGVIHTYDTTSEDAAAAKHATLIEQQAANKAKNLFTLVDGYLNKAYTNGDSHLIASAERQLENLMNQYPEYAQVYPDHAQKLRAYKTKLLEKSIDEALIGGITVKPGMKISSELHQYVVTEIHHGPTELEIIFENENKIRYVVGETSLAAALTADAINPDEFFAPFILQNN